MSRRLFFFTFLLCVLSVTVSNASHTSEAALWGEETKSFETAGLFFGEKRELGSAQDPALPLWLEYAVPPSEEREEAPMIAIVIDDLGVNRKMTEAVLALPVPITASFLAYADDLQEQTERAREKGHELLMHIPMEPFNAHRDPGPDALRAGMPAEEITEKLDAMLSAFDGYVGINNHMGSKFTATEKSIKVVIDDLKERGLLFLDSLTSGGSVGWKLAREKHVPYAVRDIFLDDSRDESEIAKQLALLEKHALRHHTAVAIGHPHPVTVDALKRWIPQAREKGFVFVPISMIALIGQDAF